MHPPICPFSTYTLLRHYWVLVTGSPTKRKLFSLPTAVAEGLHWTIHASSTCAKRSNSHPTNVRSIDSISTLRFLRGRRSSKRLKKLVSTGSTEGDCWLKFTITANNLEIESANGMIWHWFRSSDSVINNSELYKCIFQTNSWILAVQKLLFPLRLGTN